MSTKHKVLIISGVTVYMMAMSALGRRMRQPEYPEAVIPDDVPPLPLPLIRRSPLDWDGR